MRYIAPLMLSLALITSSPAIAKPLLLSPDDMAALSNKNVAYVIHDKPSFVAMTPAKGAFAMLGAFAGISAGNELVKKNNIADPADNVGKSLQEELINKFKAVALEHNPAFVKNSKIDGMISIYPDGNYVVEVETTGWSILYYPLAWGTYHVDYMANVNVVDLKNKKVIAHDKCKVTIGDSKTGPSYDELTKDGATLLKQDLATLGENCVAVLKVSLLGESPTPNTSNQPEQKPESPSSLPTDTVKPAEDNKMSTGSDQNSHTTDKTPETSPPPPTIN